MSFEAAKTRWLKLFTPRSDPTPPAPSPAIAASPPSDETWSTLSSASDLSAKTAVEAAINALTTTVSHLSESVDSARSDLAKAETTLLGFEAKLDAAVAEMKSLPNAVVDLLWERMRMGGMLGVTPPSVPDAEGAEAAEWAVNAGGGGSLSPCAAAFVPMSVVDLPRDSAITLPDEQFMPVHDGLFDAADIGAALSASAEPFEQLCGAVEGAASLVSSSPTMLPDSSEHDSVTLDEYLLVQNTLDLAATAPPAAACNHDPTGDGSNTATMTSEPTVPRRHSAADIVTPEACQLAPIDDISSLFPPATTEIGEAAPAILESSTAHGALPCGSSTADKIFNSETCEEVVPEMPPAPAVPHRCPSAAVKIINPETYQVVVPGIPESSRAPVVDRLRPSAAAKIVDPKTYQKVAPETPESSAVPATPFRRPSASVNIINPENYQVVAPEIPESSTAQVLYCLHPSVAAKIVDPETRQEVAPEMPDSSMAPAAPCRRRPAAVKIVNPENDRPAEISALVAGSDSSHSEAIHPQNAAQAVERPQHNSAPSRPRRVSAVAPRGVCAPVRITDPDTLETVPIPDSRRLGRPCRPSAAIKIVDPNTLKPVETGGIAAGFRMKEFVPEMSSLDSPTATPYALQSDSTLVAREHGGLSVASPEFVPSQGPRTMPPARPSAVTSIIDPCQSDRLVNDILAMLDLDEDFCSSPAVLTKAGAGQTIALARPIVAPQTATDPIRMFDSEKKMTENQWHEPIKKDTSIIDENMAPLPRSALASTTNSSLATPSTSDATTYSASSSPKTPRTLHTVRFAEPLPSPLAPPRKGSRGQHAVAAHVPPPRRDAWLAPSIRARRGGIWYSREFLLQFKDAYLERPERLPSAVVIYGSTMRLGGQC
ncbi:hypothetical protein BDK51DRAFT_41576 [Blyttiomyces helicus]|uniref:Uncharacterized protein n=1 Tax=Blyttiomyces helicus TaxID=388810 RepID=A0A4P9WN69_9FUNG|nr:hypothetical protein BDK51DRAFT_41576 [Blyttiomyces helicus]|eukprot:RKO94539.1 hypothetical protein BDK51DRAFT_41576 [Blyttiomyces helicus]